MENKPFIQAILELLDFVKWDRYTNPTPGELHFYGWIDREKDSYKDFVVLSRVDSDWWFITSSASRTDEINTILGLKKSDHSDCLRVEDRFDIENSVKLIK